MFIFSNNKYFAILLGRLELHALSPLRCSISPWYNCIHILWNAKNLLCVCAYQDKVDFSDVTDMFIRYLCTLRPCKYLLL